MKNIRSDKIYVVISTKNKKLPKFLKLREFDSIIAEVRKTRLIPVHTNLFTAAHLHRVYPGRLPAGCACGNFLFKHLEF